MKKLRLNKKTIASLSHSEKIVGGGLTQDCQLLTKKCGPSVLQVCVTLDGACLTHNGCFSDIIACNTRKECVSVDICISGIECLPTKI